LTVSDEEVS
jgi:hypothetical protein